MAAPAADDPNVQYSGGAYPAFFSSPYHVHRMPTKERNQLNQDIDELMVNVNLTGDSALCSVLDQLVYLRSIRDQIL
jgi:hypothetical protein